MIVDTSAVVAILRPESEAERMLAALSRSRRVFMSAGNAVEFGVVARTQGLLPPGAGYEAWLADVGIVVMPVDETQVRLAWDAFARFGKGRHPAALNLGDCFAYALSVHLARPLLFKGNDFARTDVDRVAY